jgi:hypothetical protein
VDENAELAIDVPVGDSIAGGEAVPVGTERAFGDAGLNSPKDRSARLLDGLAAPTVRMRVWRGQTLPGVLERTLEEHRTIADALDAHDADLAYAAATVHIAGVEAWVRTLKPGWRALAAQHIHAHGTQHGRLVEK